MLNLNSPSQIVRARLVLIAFFSVYLIGIPSNSRAADAPRNAEQIKAAITDAEWAMPYRLVTQLDPQYRDQIADNMGSRLQHLLDLTAEMEKTDPTAAVGERYEKCLILVRMALFKNDDALKTLTDLSNSSNASDAVLGKAGLLMDQWWTAADYAMRKRLVSEFKTLATANPKDDLLVPAALDMAEFHAHSDKIGNSLRDIVDKDLTGPAAVRYHKNPAKIGRPFKLAVRGIDRSNISMVNWKGKVVLIDFWATWCPPCREAIPNLVKVYQADHAKGLEVLGISNDLSWPELKTFLAAHKEMAWPQTYNVATPNALGSLARQMGVDGIPTTFIIDRNGILRDISVCYIDQDLINNLLAEPVKPAP